MLWCPVNCNIGYLFPLVQNLDDLQGPLYVHGHGSWSTWKATLTQRRSDYIPSPNKILGAGICVISSQVAYCYTNMCTYVHLFEIRFFWFLNDMHMWLIEGKRKEKALNIFQVHKIYSYTNTSRIRCLSWPYDPQHPYIIWALTHKRLGGFHRALCSTINMCFHLGQEYWKLTLKGQRAIFENRDKSKWMIFNVQKLFHLTKIFMPFKAKINSLVCPKLMYKDLIAKTHYIKVQYKEALFPG